jgi:predicted ribosomally synthesized peptide with nif11-like leader
MDQGVTGIQELIDKEPHLIKRKTALLDANATKKRSVMRMSRELAQSFMEKVRTDAAFAAAFAQTKSAAEVAALAESLGYDFTQAELEAASQELSASDLQMVSGGAVHCWGGGLPCGT